MTPVHMPPPDALHGTVDKIIRRQQGRLIGQLRQKGKLDQETTSAVCQSIGWLGKDIHAAISGEYQEAGHAPAPR